MDLLLNVQCITFYILCLWQLCCFRWLYCTKHIPAHSHHDDQTKRHEHTRVRVVSIQQTHGTAVPWVGQTKSPSCCAHTRLNWHVGSVHMWNVLFQAPFAQSVGIYTMLMEYCWTILSRCKFGNTPFNTRTNDHGQRWCVSNFLLAFFKPSKSYFRSRTMSWPCFRPSSPF